MTNLYTVRNDETFEIVAEIEADCPYNARMIASRTTGLPAWQLTANETLRG